MPKSRRTLSRSLRIAPFAILGLGLFDSCVPKAKQISTAPTVNRVAPASTATGISEPLQARLRFDGQAAVEATATHIAAVLRHGQLSVRGTHVVSEKGQPVVLRGLAFGWDNWWPQYYNAGVVRWLREDWCVDVIRPAMGIEPGGAYLANPDLSTKRITTVIEAAIEEGLYVLVDWHAHKFHEKAAVDFFAQLAKRYGDKPNVIYELFNEPEKDATWQQVKDYSNAVIAAIRQHDPDNLIVVGSPEWDQRIDLVAASPITGQKNVLYSVHFYAATHGQWLRDRTQTAIDAGIPVIVTESSGAEASGRGRNDYAEWNAWIDFMEKNQISWLNYSISNKAGETISVLQPQAKPGGGWTSTELTESGQQVRGMLRSFCQ